MHAESPAQIKVLRGRNRWTRKGPGAAAVAVLLAVLGTLASAAPAVAAAAPAALAVASPGISAPPDVIVGEASGSVSLPVTLSAPGTQTVTVAYATSTGGGCNFLNQSASGTLTFPAGVTTKVVRVVLNNCHVGGTGWFSLNLSGPVNATVTDASTLVGIVGDPAPAGTPGLYVRDAVVDTGAGTVSVPVLLGGPSGATSASTVTVKYATRDGSAVAGTDYTAESGTLTFGPGQTVRSITVPITGRSGAAPSRSFGITLSSAVNAVIANATGAVTIGASGATPVASPAISAPPNAVVGETDGYVDLPVTLSAPGTRTVTVAYATSTGGGCNFLNQSASGTLTFPAGVTTKFVRVIVNNCDVGGTGWFYLNLSGAVNATITDPSALVGIVGDPAPTGSPPGLYVRDAVVDTGAGTVSVPVLLGGPAGATSASTVTVKYATTDGSAVAGTDYTAVSGTLTFGPGQTVRTITVPITARSGAAASRSFGITLSGPGNAVLSNRTGVVTIGASGAAAVLSPGISAPPNAVVGETDGYVDLPVTLSAPGTRTVTVAYATSTGGGCNFLNQSASGTLTFTPGVTTKVVRIILNDCGTGGMGWFYLNLSGAVNATITDPSALVGIVGAPAPTGSPPGLYVRDAVVDTGAGTVSVPVLLGGPAGATSASTVTVKYATTDGSAVAGKDYTAVSGSLTFGPGQTVRTITVPITARTGAVGARSFGITLSGPQNAVLTDRTGVITIGASGAAAVLSPRISAPPGVTVAETSGYVDLPVTLSAPGTRTVTVAYATSTGGGCNFLNQSASGTLTFTPGVTTKVVRIILNNCGTTTGATFSLNLSAATNATIVSPSTLVTIVPMATHPGAPTHATAVAGSGSATVSFRAPASDGGDPVNSYTVTAAPGGATASGITSPITVPGLVSGTTYTFTVTAANPEGTGPASAPSNPVIP